MAARVAVSTGGPQGTEEGWHFDNVTNVRISKGSVALTYVPPGSNIGTTVHCRGARVVAMIVEKP